MRALWSLLSSSCCCSCSLSVCVRLRWWCRQHDRRGLARDGRHDAAGTNRDRKRWAFRTTLSPKKRTVSTITFYISGPYIWGQSDILLSHRGIIAFQKDMVVAYDQKIDVFLSSVPWSHVCLFVHIWYYKRRYTRRDMVDWVLVSYWCGVITRRVGGWGLGEVYSGSIYCPVPVYCLYAYTASIRILTENTSIMD